MFCEKINISLELKPLSRRWDTFAATTLSTDPNGNFQKPNFFHIFHRFCPEASTREFLSSITRVIKCQPWGVARFSVRNQKLDVVIKKESCSSISISLWSKRFSSQFNLGMQQCNMTQSLSRESPKFLKVCFLRLMNPFKRFFFLELCDRSKDEMELSKHWKQLEKIQNFVVTFWVEKRFLVEKVG